MRIIQCDSCHAQVNDYAHWYNGEKSRNMYELTCVHDSGEFNTFDKMIICHNCILKFIHLHQKENVCRVTCKANDTTTTELGGYDHE